MEPDQEELVSGPSQAEITEIEAWLACNITVTGCDEYRRYRQMFIESRRDRQSWPW